MMSDFNDYQSYFSGASHLPSSDDSSNSRPMEAWSMFGDDSCGEPLVAQHIVIDFTPNDNDTDFVQKKVCSFWQFINNHPEIQNLKVKPDKCEDHSESTNSIAPQREVVKPQPGENVGYMDRSACSVLEILQEKGVSIDKRPSKPCSVKQRAPSTVKKMCMILKEWDDKHPKSMDPPGPTIPIQHCIIQRQVFDS